MNIEELREYCLSLPLATEDMAFGEDHLLFRVCDKIFACCDLEHTDQFVVKAEPDYVLQLREEYREIEPAWHWNKKYWNQIDLSGTLSDDFLQSLIRHSYAQVVAKLPKRIKTANPSLLEITD